MKKFSVIFLVLFLLTSSNNHSQSLSAQIENVLKDSLLTVSQISVDIYDLQKEEYLFRKNENLIMRPASNLKLLTTCAALIYLGIDEEFKTTFFTDGVLTDSTLVSNIIIKGGFDPLFTVSDFDALIEKLKIIGVKKIEGDIYADISAMDSLYFGRGWMWDDNPNSFMPYLSPLNINKNFVTIYFSPSKPGELANVKFKPKSSYYSFKNSLITTDEDSSNYIITRGWMNNTNNIFLSGKISKDHSVDSAKVNIVDPHLFFIKLFTEILAKNGINFNGNTGIRTSLTGHDTLFVIERNILDVIKETNKVSDNLSAEMLLRKLSERYFSGSASVSKSKILIDRLIVMLDYNPKTFVVADGSGLSHYNLVSTALMVDLLKFMYKEHPDLYGILYDSLPIAGIDGTLKNRMKSIGTIGNVRAKSGTISGVSTLSGYLKAANNHLIAFSIFIQNYSGSPRVAREIQNEICEILAGYK